MSIRPTPTAEEQAAVLAAIAQFVHDTAPSPATQPPLGPWKLAALVEGVTAAPDLRRPPPRWAAFSPHLDGNTS